MPKSTPSPTNKAIKAMEMMLNTPTASRPSAMVTASPTTSVTRMARISLKERSASHSVSSTPPSMVPPISQTRSVRETRIPHPTAAHRR
jgi:hypothetical protein